MSTSDIGEASKCLARAFSKGEPMTSELGITEEEFEVFSKEICEKATVHQLSIVVRDKESDQLIACSIIGIDEDEQSIPELTNKFDPIFALLDHLSSSLPRIKESEKAAHIFTIAVDEAYQGKGIAKMLLALQINVLKEAGYDYFYGEFTNNRSYQAVLQVVKSDAQNSSKVSYADFCYKDQYPFKNLEGSAVAYRNSANSLKPEYKKWVQLQEVEAHNLSCCL